MATVTKSRRRRAKAAAALGPSPATSAQKLEEEEALTLPARYLGGLPVSTRFTLKMHGIAWEIVWTSERSPDPGGGIVFDAGEVEAIAVAVQAERLWAADLRGFCLHKLHDPSFRVTAQLALDGAQPVSGAAWSLGRVLRGLDLELLGVELATSRSSLPPTSSESAAA